MVSSWKETQCMVQAPSLLYTAATGGDGLVVLENPAYSQPRDLHTAPGTQPPTATVGGDRQQKNNREYEPVDI